MIRKALSITLFIAILFGIQEKSAAAVWTQEGDFIVSGEINKTSPSYSDLHYAKVPFSGETAAFLFTLDDASDVDTYDGEPCPAVYDDLAVGEGATEWYPVDSTDEREGIDGSAALGYCVQGSFSTQYRPGNKPSSSRRITVTIWDYGTATLQWIPGSPGDSDWLTRGNGADGERVENVDTSDPFAVYQLKLRYTDPATSSIKFIKETDPDLFKYDPIPPADMADLFFELGSDSDDLLLVNNATYGYVQATRDLVILHDNGSAISGNPNGGYHLGHLIIGSGSFTLGTKGATNNAGKTGSAPTKDVSFDADPFANPTKEALTTIASFLYTDFNDPSKVIVVLGGEASIDKIGDTHFFESKNAASPATTWGDFTHGMGLSLQGNYQTTFTNAEEIRATVHLSSVIIRQDNSTTDWVAGKIEDVNGAKVEFRHSKPSYIVIEP